MEPKKIGSLPHEEKVRMALSLLEDVYRLLNQECDDETVSEFIEAVTQGLC